MRESARRQSVVFAADMLMAVTVFFFCRYIGSYPKWYWLVLSGLFWSLVGMASQKLQFERYRRVRVAVVLIVLVDLLSYAVIVIAWRLAFPQRCGGILQWHPIVLLIFLELMMYQTFRRYVIKKIPYFFDDLIIDEKCEPYVASGVKADEVKSLIPEWLFQKYETIRGLSLKELKEWFHREIHTFRDTLVLDTVDSKEIEAAPVKDPILIVVRQPYNDIWHLNTFLATANLKLADGGCIVIHGQTSGARKARIYMDNPRLLGHLVYGFDYLWRSVIPKMKVTRWFYHSVTKGRDRNISRVEILGRLCRSGFTIANEQIIDGEYVVTAVKTAPPVTGDRPNIGPVIRLKRIGYQGETIGVLKFRTMYPYSEYLQKYAYQRMGLETGGKIKSDFRVNPLGKFLRSVWLDELPMIFNWIAGDIKLVGVRPLSEQYFSLYTPYMQQLRISVKPGLIPPFYYEAKSPETLDEIQESERRYIEDYLKAPFRTDCRYFFRILVNIVFKHRRSR